MINFINKKKLLADILFHTNTHYILSIFSRNRLIVFNYHRIKSDDYHDINIYDEMVYGPCASQFKKQMIWLKNNANIIRESDLIDHAYNRKPFSKPSVLITFDDGYIDNYTIAYPFLKSLDIPAIFFIPTHQISERVLGWWDIIAYLIKASKKKTIFFEDIFIDIVDKEKAIAYIFNKIKKEGFLPTIDVLQTLSKSCDVPIPEKSMQSKELMTWDQIREISNNGITIGSHTNNHFILSSISDDKQKDELLISKTIIETETNNIVNSISYPVGGNIHFNNYTEMAASECGYKLGFSFHTGINYNLVENKYNIKRIAAPSRLEDFAAYTSTTNIFFKGCN